MLTRRYGACRDKAGLGRWQTAPVNRRGGGRRRCVAPLVVGADTANLGDKASCCAQVASVAPMSQEAATRHVSRELPVGVAPEKGLQVDTILAARAISGMFPAIMKIGGVRPDSMRWHPNGLAIDVMIPNYRTAEGKALGDRIVAFALDHAGQFGLNHVLWRQTSYGPKRAPRPYGQPRFRHREPFRPRSHRHERRRIPDR